MSLFDLLREDVLLVEEEHDGRGGEVAVVADTVEQVQALVHAVLRRTKAVGHRGTGVATPLHLTATDWPTPACSLGSGPPSVPRWPSGPAGWRGDSPAAHPLPAPGVATFRLSPQPI